MADHLRGCGLRDADQVIERHHRPGVRPYVELPHVLRRRPELLVYLNVNAIRTVVEIKVVYICRPHVHAQRVSDLRQGNVQTLGLLAIDGHHILGIVGREWRIQADEIFSLSCVLNQPLRCAREFLQWVRCLVLYHELKSAELAESLDGGRERGKDDSSLYSK